MDYMFDKNYNDYYNLISKYYNINMMKRELIKFKTEKEMIENQCRFVNLNYISTISLIISIFTLIMGSVDKINLQLKTKTGIFIISVLTILVLLFALFVIEVCHIKNNKERNKKIYELNLKIQIIENMIAEIEKKK